MINPLVSIIVPVYNAERYLNRCIDSIFKQTFPDWELLLINDGSTDGSGIICSDYAEKDLRVRVFQKSNGGVSSARNIGIDEAKGKWIMFVDADDYLFEESLECLLNVSCIDLVVGGYIRIHRSTGNSYTFLANNKVVHIGIETELTEKLIETFLFTPWCKLFKREIIEANKLRFNQDLFYGEDTDFVLKYIIKIDFIQFISQPVYCYCYNEARSEKYVFKAQELLSLIECMYKNFDLFSERIGASLIKLRDALLHDYCSLYLDGLLKIKSFRVFRIETKGYNFKKCVFCVNTLKNKIIILLLKYCPIIYFSYAYLHQMFLIFHKRQ